MVEGPKDIMKAFLDDIIKVTANADEIKDSVVKKFGSSAHVMIHPKHIGKPCKIIVHNLKREKSFSMETHSPEDSIKKGEDKTIKKDRN